VTEVFAMYALYQTASFKHTGPIS